MKRPFLGILLAAGLCPAQEATSGFDLHTTVAVEGFHSRQLTLPPRSGQALDAGFQAFLYPTWKLNQNWEITSVFHVSSSPYFTEQFSTAGRHVTGRLFQLNLSYSRFWKDRSVVVRVGQLSSNFGAFLTRYDPSANPLVGLPHAYGYYYKPVSFAGLAGAQVEYTTAKWDARAQFVNSSAANPRTVFANDQYGNWAGGAGYTVRQGFRVGGSAYYGPYLDRRHRFFRPGEARPVELPGLAYGLDVQWGKGPWNAWGEWQRFEMAYRVIPTTIQHTGYAELRRVLSPRWYAAGRVGYLRASSFPGTDTYEMTLGLRPNRHQILKFGYQVAQGPRIRGTLGNTAFIQLVSSFNIFSASRQ